METVNHLKLRVERTHAPAVVRALLFAIFFHRYLDSIEPDTIEVLETHVAAPGKLPDKTLEREIERKVDEFLEIVDSGADSGEIAVVFLQRKNRKGWFAVTEALVPWEEHLITITFVKRATTNPLPGALLQLLTFCTEHKCNVPPMVGTGDQNNLHHQILISPPPPSDLFESGSPPSSGPPRRVSPPLRPATAAPLVGGAGTADGTGPPKPRSPTPGPSPRLSLGSPVAYPRSSSRSSSPMAAGTSSAMGYLGQAKVGLLAGAKAAGAGVGWGGRAVGAAFGGRS